MLPRLNQLRRSVNTPAGGASAVTPSLNSSDIAPLAPDIFFYVEPPAMTTGQLPDGETLTYSLIESNNANLTSPINTTVMGIQTGSGGAGAAAAIFAARLKYAGGQYVGLKIAASASANAQGVAITMALAQL